MTSRTIFGTVGNLFLANERDRLKWVGVFYRKQTPGAFMMRLRMSSGFSNSEQFRAIAEISEAHGPGFVDLTTRQQIQLRGFAIENVQHIWNRLEEVGLGSLQTGFRQHSWCHRMSRCGIDPERTL